MSAGLRFPTLMFVVLCIPASFTSPVVVRAGERVEVLSPSMGFNMRIQPPAGREMVKAVATTRRVDIAPAFPAHFKSLRDVVAARKSFFTALPPGTS